MSNQWRDRDSHPGFGGRQDESREYRRGNDSYNDSYGRQDSYRGRWEDSPSSGWQDRNQQRNFGNEWGTSDYRNDYSNEQYQNENRNFGQQYDPYDRGRRMQGGPLRGREFGGGYQQGSYGNPYQREGNYRPYESGYDSPSGSIAREHYQPTSSFRNQPYSGYRSEDYRNLDGRSSMDQGSEDLYGRGWQGSYGNEGMYGSRGWQGDNRSQGSSNYGNQGSYGSRTRQGYSNDSQGWQNNAWQNQEQGQYRGYGPRNYTRSDERISEEINDRLSDNPFLDATDIDVSVKNGEVTLSGTVDSRQAKRQAEDIAEEVSGVKDVENHIKTRKQRDRQEDQSGTGKATRTGQRSDSKATSNSKMLQED